MVHAQEANSIHPERDPRTTGTVHPAAPRLILPGGAEWPLTGEAVAIGRQVGNHLRINDPAVSARHAKIVYDGDAYILIDHGSSNGTFVNGQRVQDLHVLRHSDEIEVANQRFRFDAGVSAPAPDDASTSGPTGRQAAGTAELGVLLCNELPLTGRELTMGRAADNQLMIPDPRTSSHHAKVVCLDGNYWLLDLNSSNGTFVNDQRVHDVRKLRDGDVIAIGATTFTFARRTVRVDLDDSAPEVPSSFVFADLTGRRWLASRILVAVIALVLIVIAIMFVQFILR